MMDLAKTVGSIAQQFLTDANSDGKVDLSDVTGSIQNLLSGSSGNLDFGSLVAKLQGMGFSETVSSWLGDGDNKPISAADIGNLFDSDKLSQFASSLNIDVESAKNGLANAVPNLVDKLSSGGKLLDLAGGEVGGLLSKLKSFFSG